MSEFPKRVYREDESSILVMNDEELSEAAKKGFGDHPSTKKPKPEPEPKPEPIEEKFVGLKAGKKGNPSQSLEK